MQGIYTYIPETNCAPGEYSVAAILLFLFMVLISLVPVLNLLYFYISTFRSMCAVPTSCFPGMLLTYFVNDSEIVPVAPVITGITFVFTFHMHMIIIIIVILIIISYMQGICTYIPETNCVPREYSVAAILLLLFMVLISLVWVVNLLYFYLLLLLLLLPPSAKVENVWSYTPTPPYACLARCCLTLILLTWIIWWANNASKCQMGFNSAFKGLNTCTTVLNAVCFRDYSCNGISPWLCTVLSLLLLLLQSHNQDDDVGRSTQDPGGAGYTVTTATTNVSRPDQQCCRISTLIPNPPTTR